MPGGSSGGSAAAVAAGFARVAEGRWRRIALAGAAVGLLSCALLTARQAAEYRDAGTLWRATLARNPGSSLAWVHLGKIHMQAGRHEEAVRCFRRAS